MFTTAALLLSMGCTSGVVQAPYGSTVVTPDNIQLSWTAAYNDYDLAGAVQLFDIMVLGADNLPLENVEIDISTSYGGVYIVPQESIELVGYPSVPADVQSYEDLERYCTVDEDGDGVGDGNIYTLNYDWCAWYWDTVNDTYYSFAGTYADNYTNTDSGDLYWFAPTYVRATTDNRGTYRGYLLVDTLQNQGEGSYADVVITASIGVDVGTFSLQVIN
jgi:hypothetical protein